MYKEDILRCIKNSVTSAEMAYKLGIHDLNLYQEINKLEHEGYTLSRSYFSDGNFKYSFGYRNVNKIDEPIDIISRCDEQDIKILCLSDIHLTSKYENKGALDDVFKYAEEHGIHIILLGGDILHGKYGASEVDFADGADQINRFIEEYPFRNNILTFGVGGDHDYSIYERDHINPIKVITEARHDIVIPGYRNALFRIKNTPIRLLHTVSHIDDSPIYLCCDGETIIINGHYHIYEIKSDNNQIQVKLPTLSNMTDNLNGFVVLTLHYEDNKLTSVKSKFKSNIYKRYRTICENTMAIETEDLKVNNVVNYNKKEIINPYTMKPFVNYEEEYNELNTKLEEKESTIETLETKVECLEKEKSVLTEKVLKEEFMNLQNKEEIKSLTKDLETKDAKIFRLKDNNERLKESNTQLGKNNKDLTNRTTELLDELKKAKKELQDAALMVDAMTTEPKPEEVVETPVEEPKKGKMNILASGDGRQHIKLISTIATKPDIVDESLLEDEDYKDKMCDMFDKVSLELSSGEEKKKTLKIQKSIEKGKKIDKSQMTKAERLEELKKKYMNKNK